MTADPAADPDCLFCRIVAHEVPSTVVSETSHSLAFRDISPAAPTHVLVIPKAHYPDAVSLATASPEGFADLMVTADAVALEEGLGERGYRVVINTGRDAGQTVFHAHAHVLGGRDLRWPPG
ncbi:histidine triad nucleotide-binding protein [Acidothermaceae bacterium B102]|nr:histidine triad nucleotide-binding protein [Acidothermaceae bacterium B102]